MRVIAFYEDKLSFAPDIEPIKVAPFSCLEVMCIDDLGAECTMARMVRWKILELKLVQHSIA